MYTFFAASERWISNIDWLNTRFSFSFAEYYNPERMWFGTLRVLNDDTISGWKGFWMHPHQDMEIITIPFSWSLEHKDSMWNHGIIKVWEVQSMSAWSGILHSEINADVSTPVSLFQIWIQTKYTWIIPQYSQKYFDASKRINTWQLVAQSEDSEKTVKINQDAYISRTTLNTWKSLEYQKYVSKNIVYIMNISWEFQIDTHILSSKDALWVEWDTKINITSLETSDILVIEVPKN